MIWHDWFWGLTWMWPAFKGHWLRLPFNRFEVGLKGNNNTPNANWLQDSVNGEYYRNGRGGWHLCKNTLILLMQLDTGHCPLCLKGHKVIEVSWRRARVSKNPQNWITQQIDVTSQTFQCQWIDPQNCKQKNFGETLKVVWAVDRFLFLSLA